jgi:hypothetical protein
MSAAQALDPTTEPDPPRAGADTPTRLSRVLSVVRKLIDYGRQLVSTVQQRATTPDFAFFARPFGTVDLGVILTRITNGLRRAAALEARLCQRAARGKDLTVAPIRLPAAPGSRPARQVVQPGAQPEPQPEDPRFARLLTEEEIAAEVRRRPVGAVIVDICRDLGVAPGDLDRAFWAEINLAIILYGGSAVRFHNDLHKRMWDFALGNLSDEADPEWPAPPSLSPVPTTGPPPEVLAAAD